MTATNFARMFSPAIGMVVAAPSPNNFTVDASNEGVAWVFDARSTQAITHIGYRYGARTGTPPTFIAGLEGVSATTGFPDGTYKTNGGNCSGTFTPPASSAINGLWQWVALTNSYTPTLGERLAITIRYSSGTIDVSNNSSFSTHLSTGVSSLPYAVRNTSGTWAAQTTSPIFGIRTASSRYGAIYQGAYATRTASTVGHRAAMKISLPAGFGNTFRIAGFRAVASIANDVGKLPVAKIWSASSALASKTLDTDQVGASAAGAYRTVQTFFDTAVDLNFGSDYYIGFEVADATNGGVILYGNQYAEADDKGTDDSGSYLNLSTFNGSVWSDDTTVRPLMELIVDDWTEPSGGGGAIVIPTAARMIG